MYLCLREHSQFSFYSHWSNSFLLSGNVIAIRYYFKKEPSAVSKPESSPDFKQFINRCDLDGSTALHLAVQTGSKEVSQVLIQYGADVNCQNKTLQTPIYLAAVGGHQEVLKMLILQGGNVNAIDSLQKTALHRYLLLKYVIDKLKRTYLSIYKVIGTD